MQVIVRGLRSAILYVIVRAHVVFVVLALTALALQVATTRPPVRHLVQAPELQLPLAGPVLLTNNGVYSQPVGELPVLNHNFTAPVDRPAAPGDAFLPGFSGSPANGAPVISSFTSQAGPGNSIVFTGMNFTSLSGDLALSDTRVLLFSQSAAGTGRLRSLAILRADAGSITAQVPADVSYGMYLVWIQNAASGSYPVRVNAAQAWWIGPSHAQAGDVVGVYGRNLSTQNGESTSEVYARPWGADAQSSSIAWKVLRVNPNKVVFQVPAGLTADRAYEIWIHNGHGGDYGWAGPLKLYVEANPRYAWAGPAIDVTAYGAKPDDGIDDSAAIQAAFDAAGNGSVVKFPAGRFLISRKITVSRSVSIEGAGGSATILDATPSSLGDTAILFVHAFPARVRNIGFNSRVVNNVYPYGGILFFDGEGISPSPAGAIVENSTFVSPSGASYTSIGSRSINDLRVTGSTFTTGFGIIFNNGFQAFVQGNTFLGNWPDQNYSGQGAVLAQGSNELDVSGNTARSIDRANHQTLIRLFVAQGQGHGLTSNHYVGGNQTQGLGCATEVCGEQILFETTGAFYSGPPASWTADTLTFSGVSWTANLLAQNDRLNLLPYGQRRPALAMIQNGRGAGQYRRIVANTSNRISLDRRWDVAPDQTSIVTILTGSFQSAVYGNTLTGFPQALANTHLQNGGIFAGYGSQMDAVVSHNTIDSVAVGIETIGLINASCSQSVPGLSGTSPNLSNCPNWGILITQNNISNTLYGIVSWTGLSAPQRSDPGPLMMGVVIRENRIANSKNYAIGIGDVNSWSVDGLWQRYAVVEGNTATDAPVYVNLLGLQSDTVVRGNVFHNAGAYPEPVGLRFDSLSHSPFLYDNEYDLGSGSAYGGNAPGPSLQLTQRSLTLNDGVLSSDPVVVRNGGTDGLNLSVSSSAPWLDGALTTTSLPGERDSGQLTVRINPGGLAPGSYTGTLTVHGADGRLVQVVGVTAVVGTQDLGPRDTEPPTVSITSPASGQVVSGVVTVAVNATDNVRVAGVSLVVDGNPTGVEQTAGPYRFAFDSTSVSNGSHTLAATARDAAGNRATSAPIPVTVTNVLGVERPLILSVVPGRLRTDYGGWLGMQVTIAGAPVKLTALGRFVIAGNNTSLIVKVVEAASGADVPGASVVISSGAGSPGNFNYVQLPSPVILQPNSAYYVVSEQQYLRDQFFHSDTVVNASPVASVDGAIYWDNGSKWILEGGANHSFVAVDIRYQAQDDSLAALGGKSAAKPRGRR